MILFLHHRYRLAGGEERAVEDLARLVREQLDEPVEILERRSDRVGRGRAAAGVLRGGLSPDEVADAVRRTGARVVHAHNLHPTFGWRGLAAARAAGAAVVLHLHQYRIVCAIGICFRDGHDCTRCHGRNTLPGIALNCRGSIPEAVAYGAGLALWQPKLARGTDACIVPSRFALERLRAIGAPVADPRVIAHPVWPPGTLVSPAQTPQPLPPGARDAPFGLFAGRLVPEKGLEVALAACSIAGLPLLVAGEGPERERLERLHPPPTAHFLGVMPRAALDDLRRQAAVQLAPSLTGESFGLAAAEAMAAGLPVVGSRVGALPELVPHEWLVAPGNPVALAEAISRVRSEAGASERARRVVDRLAAPSVVAPALAAVYEEAVARRAARASAA